MNDNMDRLSSPTSYVSNSRAQKMFFDAWFELIDLIDGIKDRDTRWKFSTALMRLRAAIDSRPTYISEQKITSQKILHKLNEVENLITTYKKLFQKNDDV